MPVPHHSVFYRPDVLPAAQPTVSVKALKALTSKDQECPKIQECTKTVQLAASNTPSTC